MAVTTTLPGAVTDAGPPWRPTATIVGDPPQWADGSDATHATVEHFTSGTFPRQQQAVAPGVTPTIPQAAITRIAVWVRASLSAAGDPETPHFMTLGIDWGSSFGSSMFTSAMIPVGTPGEHELDLYLVAGSENPLIESPATLADFLASTSFIFTALSGGNAAGSATVYEAELRIYHGAAPRPPQRIHPRDDGLFGSAPRNYPPSKTRQRGNRIAGGYF